MSHQFDPSVLREYGVRGIIGETLGPDDARFIGRVFGSMLREAGGSQLMSLKGCMLLPGPYSTVTDLARLRGWSTSVPLTQAT